MIKQAGPLIGRLSNSLISDIFRAKDIGYREVLGMMRVGILGPTGYAGLQLINILLAHPEAEIVYLGSRREERPHIAEIWPALNGRIDMRCSLLGTDPLPLMDVCFVALPHTVAMHHVPSLLDRGIKVVDISADYRLKNPDDYTKWYNKEHTDQKNLGRAVYGLCELFRDEIRGAELIANPGCYPTGILLALAPLLQQHLVAGGSPIMVDAKSGISGAGRNPRPNLHFPEANESVTAYKVGVHQHTGELLQALARLAGRRVEVIFVPHLIPMDRGILTTCYVPLAKGTDTQALLGVYRSTYEDDHFVRVRDDGSIPATKDVFGTNFCDLAARGFAKTAVVISCIDNLIKGASGQAVQNMNIMFGLDETLGLK